VVTIAPGADVDRDQFRGPRQIVRSADPDRRTYRQSFRSELA
jgi:hypothetical protein